MVCYFASVCEQAVAADLTFVGQYEIGGPGSDTLDFTFGAVFYFCR